MPNNKFDIFVPFDAEKTKKSNEGNSDSGTVLVAGWASTPDWDYQGEKVDPVGIDASYFIKSGWIDWEHDTSQVLGEPTSNTFVDAEKGLYVEAKLFKKDPHVQSVLTLIDNLSDIGSSRKPGFSIEGQIGERDPDNPRIIRSVVITGLAVTLRPADPYAQWSVVQKSLAKSNFEAKSFEAGYGITPETQVDAAALRPESLAGSITNLANGIRNVVGTPVKFKELANGVAGVLESQKDDNPYIDTVFLQLFGGVSEQEARKYVSLNNKIESED